RVCAVAPPTVRSGRGEAAEQLDACAAYVLCALPLEQRSLAAWSAGWRAVQDGARREDEAIRRLERVPSWVWTAMEPTSPLLGGALGAHLRQDKHEFSWRTCRYAAMGSPSCWLALQR